MLILFMPVMPLSDASKYENQLIKQRLMMQADNHIKLMFLIKAEKQNASVEQY